MEKYDVAPPGYIVRQSVSDGAVYHDGGCNYNPPLPQGFQARSDQVAQLIQPPQGITQRLQQGQIFQISDGRTLYMPVMFAGANVFQTANGATQAGSMQIAEPAPGIGQTASTFVSAPQITTIPVAGFATPPGNTYSKYLHESRHRHAVNRVRGEHGRFQSSEEKRAITARQKMHSGVNAAHHALRVNTEISDLSSSEGTYKAFSYVKIKEQPRDLNEGGET